MININTVHKQVATMAERVYNRKHKQLVSDIRRHDDELVEASRAYNAAVVELNALEARECYNETVEWTGYILKGNYCEGCQAKFHIGDMIHDVRVFEEDMVICEKCYSELLECYNETEGME